VISGAEEVIAADPDLPASQRERVARIQRATPQMTQLIAIRTRQPWNENRELIGQGLAKIASAPSNSMPVSGSFSRSAMNQACNARTPLSSVFSALFVLLTLPLFTPLLFLLPRPVLAAIVMAAVIGLIKFRAIANAWFAVRDDGVAAIVTFVATVTCAS